MTHYFLDSSAVVKRYLPELGSIWVRAVCDPAAGNTIVVSALTIVEVAAALAARHRAPGGIARQARDNALALFLQHIGAEYGVIDADRATVLRAVQLTQRNRLRGYDAVQLATALVAHDALVIGGLSGLTFVAADTDLLAAAQTEGLTTAHPR